MAFVLLLILAAFAANAQEPGPVTPDAPIDCDPCASWNEPITPYRIFGNTYYVGSTNGGVWKSTNGGAFDSRAGSGILKSTDGGRTW